MPKSQEGLGGRRLRSKHDWKEGYVYWLYDSTPGLSVCTQTRGTVHRRSSRKSRVRVHRPKECVGGLAILIFADLQPNLAIAQLRTWIRTSSEVRVKGSSPNL